MNTDAPRFAIRFDQQDRFVTQHEHGRMAQKMRSDDRRVGRHRMRPLFNRNGIGAGVGHSSLPGLSRQSVVC